MASAFNKIIILILIKHPSFSLHPQRKIKWSRMSTDFSKSCNITAYSFLQRENMRCFLRLHSVWRHKNKKTHTKKGTKLLRRKEFLNNNSFFSQDSIVQHKMVFICWSCDYYLCYALKSLIPARVNKLLISQINLWVICRFNVIRA